MAVTVTNYIRQKRDKTRGVARAAKVLGVTRQHLREVLLGRRQSPGLMANYEEWKNSDSAAPVTIKVPTPDEIAAHDNLTEHFLKTLSTLGLEVVLVTLKAGQGSPVFNHPDIAQELEKEIRAIEAGQLDVSYYPEGDHTGIFTMWTGLNFQWQ